MPKDLDKEVSIQRRLLSEIMNIEIIVEMVSMLAGNPLMMFSTEEMMFGVISVRNIGRISNVLVKTMSFTALI